MTPVERNVLPARGPSFFREAGEVMFQFVVDPTNTIGPRVATRADQAKHEGAWQDFCRAEGISPLDRDADGSDGGTLPAEAPLPPMATIDAVDAEDIALLDAARDAIDAGTLETVTHEEVKAALGIDETRVKRKYTRRGL